MIVKRQLLTGAFITTCAMFISGCETTAPRTKFYALSTHTPMVITQEPLELNVGIGPVHFPDMLKRPQVVIRTSKNTLVLSESHHWGGKINEDFEYVLVENVENVLQQSRVKAYPWDARQRPEYQVVVTVHQFDGHPRKDSVLRASWTIIETKTRSEIFHTKDKFSHASEKENFEGMVSSLSIVTLKLGEAIGTSLKAIVKNK